MPHFLTHTLPHPHPRIHTHTHTPRLLYVHPPSLCPSRDLLLETRQAAVVTEWKRPSEIGYTSLIGPGGEVDTADVCQGDVGDCWLLSAMCVVAAKPNALARVLVTHAVSDCGAYLVRFFIGGEWRAVVMDDRVPVRKVGGQRWRPAFAHSGTGTTLWQCLVEKAYAKICGSYQGLESGLVHVGMAELTGGAGRRIDLTSEDARVALANGDLWDMVKGYFDSVRGRGEIMTTCCCWSGAGSSGGAGIIDDGVRVCGGCVAVCMCVCVSGLHVGCRFTGRVRQGYLGRQHCQGGVRVAAGCFGCGCVAV